jgi:ABC-type branched-subunit amino acid transport system substrate-binding protein
MPRLRSRPGRDASSRPHRLRRAIVTATLVAGVVVALPAASASAGSGLSPAEARGQRLYTRGESESRRIVTAQLERGAPPAPASILPCIHCHGANGRGRPDDTGVVPPDITWGVLTEPDGHAHPGRRHGPYDETSLARAISAGIDPDGGSLDAGMPRYRMADADMADLIAYLKRVEHELDPGLSADGIRIGTVVPLDGPLQGPGRAIRDLLTAYFDRVNAAGGIRGRRVELRVAGFGAGDEPAIWAAQDLLSRETLFALVAAYVPGYEDELATLANDKRVPLIGPYSLLAPDDGPAGRFDFHVLPGLGQQTDALIEAISERPKPPGRLAVLYRHAAGVDALVARVESRASARGLDPVVSERFTAESLDADRRASELREQRVEAVVFLGSAEDLLGFARAAAAIDWHPYLLAPAALAERQVLALPTGFSRRVLLAYPSLPADRTPGGIRIFEALHAGDGALDYRHSVAQVAAFTAARVLVEGLERAGPDPDRDRLLASLEGMSGFRPGLTPPVSFGSRRRLGAQGAHVVEVDIASGALDGFQSVWISLAEE